MRTPAALLYMILLIAVTTGFTAAGKPHLPQKKITLFFHHKLGNEELVLSSPVKNILGETITVEKFKYYVSNFSVTDTRGNTVVLPVQYFLVDEANSLSKTIILTVPDISISSIGFLLGVDSTRNVSGVQTGALDPSNGMFWTWNTGYIMAKLEGSSDASASAGHRFTFDIGGFRNGINAARMIHLDTSGTGKQEQIHITADLNRWFKGSSEIRIAETPVCHNSGALAMKIADNYSHLFSINP